MFVVALFCSSHAQHGRDGHVLQEHQRGLCWPSGCNVLSHASSALHLILEQPSRVVCQPTVAPESLKEAVQEDGLVIFEKKGGLMVVK